MKNQLLRKYFKYLCLNMSSYHSLIRIIMIFKLIGFLAGIRQKYVINNIVTLFDFSFHFYFKQTWKKGKSYKFQH